MRIFTRGPATIEIWTTLEGLNDTDLEHHLITDYAQWCTGPPHKTWSGSSARRPTLPNVVYIGYGSSTEATGHGDAIRSAHSYRGKSHQIMNKLVRR
jgi:hypothetical protein